MPSPLFRPAQKYIARCLHQPLADNHSLTAVRANTFSGIRLQHAFMHLLDLEKERVVIASHHQQYGTAGTDAADSDYLNRNIFDFVTIHKSLKIIRKCFSIAEKCFFNEPIVFCRSHFFWMKNQGRVVFDSDFAIFDRSRFWKIFLAHGPGWALADLLSNDLLRLPTFNTGDHFTTRLSPHSKPPN